MGREDGCVGNLVPSFSPPTPTHSSLTIPLHYIPTPSPKPHLLTTTSYTPLLFPYLHTHPQPHLFFFLTPPLHSIQPLTCHISFLGFWACSCIDRSRHTWRLQNPPDHTCRLEERYVYLYLFILLYVYLYLFFLLYVHLYLFILLYVHLYLFILLYVHLYLFILLYVHLYLFILLYVHFYLFILLYVHLYLFILLYVYLYLFIMLYVYLYLFIMLYVYLYLFILLYVLLQVFLSRFLYFSNTCMSHHTPEPPISSIFLLFLLFPSSNHSNHIPPNFYSASSICWILHHLNILLTTHTFTQNKPTHLNHFTTTSITQPKHLPPTYCNLAHQPTTH